MQLNLVYLPSSSDQVRPKLAQLRFVKSVFVARATGTTPLIPSAGLHVRSAVIYNAESEESGLPSFPPFPSSVPGFKGRRSLWVHVMSSTSH